MRVPDSDRLRVAFTLEQCWHAVPGGTAVAAVGTARALAQRGDTDVVGVAASHRRPAPPDWLPPVPVVHLPLPRPLLYEAWHRVRAPRVQRATGPVEIIHATSIAIPPKSAPLVVTIHDLAFLHDASHFTRRGVGFFRRGLDLALRDADLVLCPSEATRSDCLARGFNAERVRVVPFAIDVVPASRDEVARVREDYRLAKPYVLWTGTIEPRKNLGGLIRAFETLDTDHDLVLVGPSGWKETAADHVADGRIRALGFVPRGDLGPLYAGADVFCFPSLREGFGFPVLEAMAQGAPVITSAGTSTEEIAGEAAVLVDPRDTGALRSALERVLGDAAAAQRMGEAGRERARSFSWKRTAELVHDAYMEIAR